MTKITFCLENDDKNVVHFEGESITFIILLTNVLKETSFRFSSFQKKNFAFSNLSILKYGPW